MSCLRRCSGRHSSFEVVGPALAMRTATRTARATPCLDRGILLSTETQLPPMSYRHGLAASAALRKLLGVRARRNCSLAVGCDRQPLGRNS
jgi:hypothetical protein